MIGLKFPGGMGILLSERSTEQAGGPARAYKRLLRGAEDAADPSTRGREGVCQIVSRDCHETSGNTKAQERGMLILPHKG